MYAKQQYVEGTNLHTYMHILYGTYMHHIVPALGPQNNTVPTASAMAADEA